MLDTSWKTDTPVDLNSGSLRALIANEIPAVRIRKFATAVECAAFSDAVRESPDIRDYSVEVPTSYLGLVMYEYRQNGGDKEGFFAAVPGAVEAQQRLFASSVDIPRRFFKLLGEHYDGRIRVAEEPGFGRYCPVIVRIASRGVHLHADFAPFNSRDWAIGQINSQITWNLYTQAPATGGETTVYNAPWTPAEGEDPAKGIPAQDVEQRLDVHSITFQASVGDIVLFNPRNPHKIAPGSTGVGDARISIGAFLGQTDDQLVMWA